MSLDIGVCFDTNYFPLDCCLVFVSGCSLFGFSGLCLTAELLVLGS